MSADMWVVCPVCGKTPKRDFEKKISLAKEEGNITLNELREMEKKLKEMEDDEETGYIYRQYGVNDKKQLYVVISFGCDKCGASAGIEKEAKIKKSKEMRQ